MAKRKACGVNDIIYELDNDDIEISSDDECKVPKNHRSESRTIHNSTRKKTVSESSCVEVIHINSENVTYEILSPSKREQNGGKSSCDILSVESSPVLITNDVSEKKIQTNNNMKQNNSCTNTLIFNEDIVVDSPANSDLGVVGCENKTPLLSVRFKDKKLASAYKRKIKNFMLNLIKLHEEDNTVTSDNETDIELDIWPDDLNPEDSQNESVDDSLFFVDTAPCDKEPIEVPSYSRNSELISNIPTQESSTQFTKSTRKGPTCFNCKGDHPLRDCPRPRNNAKIAENRKNMAYVKVGRYHVEDDQKYGHLTPGRISGALRHALSLKRHELPLYIYRMRLLGYPPGWLEDAKISHSGITMFDSAGNAILDPEEEEGEVSEPGSKDKFDIKKILDFPGFNVPASSRYKEEAHLYGLPQMSSQYSKLSMLQMLAPNAMKAYKRKKLTFFPSATKEDAQEGQAEMELGSDDEIAEFPSVPPLPDEAPPPPPPPPDSPPPEADTQTQTTIMSDEQLTPQADTQSTFEIPLTQATQNSIDEYVYPSSEGQTTQDSQSADDTAADLEVIEVTQVRDIPVPETDLIVIDEYSSRGDSPTLDDLEEKKRLLLNALIEETVTNDESKDVNTDGNIDKNNDGEDDRPRNDSDLDVQLEESLEQSQKTEKNVELQRDVSEIQDVQTSSDTSTLPVSSHLGASNEVVSPKSTESSIKHQKKEEKETSDSDSDASKSSAKKGQVNSDSDSDASKLSAKKGQVKSTSYGTPVMNIASSYVKLPSDDKFAKDICDVINFENLPNSTGKYKQMNNLLKRVKSEVDKIQES